MTAEQQSSAVAEAFRSHAGLVERVLRRAGVAERDLSDARQEVFIVVHRRLAEFEGRASLSTWLYRIALNVASDHRSRAYQRRERLASGASAAAAGDGSGAHAASEPEPGAGGEPRDPCERLEQRELLAHALRALEALDPDKREAFVLSELYGLPMREVAARLGCPQKTAFSRTYAARRRLLAELHKLGALPLFPLLIPLRALRGLRLHAPGPAALAPGVAGIAGLAGVSALAVAVALLAVPANRVPAAHERAELSVHASAPSAVRTPIQEAQRIPQRAAPDVVAVAGKTGGLETRPYAEPGRKLRRARAVPPAAMLAAPSGDEPGDEAPPRSAGGVPLDDMTVVRSGAVDVRPQLESPLARSALPAPVASPRIRVRGPREAADGIEQVLNVVPLFAYPIARD